jgi:geranylgeranyl reductase family protein
MTGPGDATVDVAIVGAGPAGCAAAVTLARAGRSVVVVDKAAFPRDKCCGDGLTALALRQLEALGLRPEAVASWTVVDRAVLHSPSGRVVSLPLPGPPLSGQYAAVARRRDLDAALVDRARAEGADVRQQTPLTAVQQDGLGVRLELGGPSPTALRAAHVIGADGMWSPLRRLAGVAVPGYRGEWHAFRQYFTDVGPAASGALHVLFEADLLPGYAWSFPLTGGRANVGFGILRGTGVAVGDMGARWQELLTRPRLRAVLGPTARPESPQRAWPIPARLGAVPLSCGRILFVGDAAATTDPLTGEGIGQALLTGVLAARAIVGEHTAPPADRSHGIADRSNGHADPPHAVAARYEASVRAELGADHHLAEMLGRVLAHGRVARGAIRLAGLTGWTRRNFARWMFEDYPRAVIATPKRWQRGMLHPEPAYRPGAGQQTS